MIPVVYRYITRNPGFFNVYSPVGTFDLYGFHDTTTTIHMPGVNVDLPTVKDSGEVVILLNLGANTT